MHELSDPPTFTMSAQDLLPIYQVYDMTDIDDIKINDEIENSLVTWSYLVNNATDSSQSKEVAAITCDKYIEKYLPDLSNKQRVSLYNELSDEPEKYLCPDQESYNL